MMQQIEPRQSTALIQRNTAYITDGMAVRKLHYVTRCRYQILYCFRILPLSDSANSSNINSSNTNSSNTTSTQYLAALFSGGKP